MKKWTHTTRRGMFMMVQELKSGQWLAQLTGQEIVETGHGPHLTDTDFLLDHFPTPEAALDHLGYPVGLVGLPAELR